MPSWALSNAIDSDFCISALKRAIRLYGTPDIFNTDQGSQFTSRPFADLLNEHSIQISMDSKGRSVDNRFIERLWRSVKYEEVYLNEYHSAEELRHRLGAYFQYYNNERTHQSLNDLTPTEVCCETMQPAIGLAA